ncbi:MAG: cysteine--tRNA ligase [Candidatus Pacearchaeota archaeon]|nr:cysteine--tRNA ligase [Candidatus Pacearchaeota archaeon]
MSLKLYNTLTRKKEKFVPIKKDEVGIYGCGPTVYWYQHIGNLRRYIFEDVLIRVLEFNDYKIKHIINVTDVGHLTSDADEGEDKMEKAAKKEGKKAEDIAKHYFDEFEKDLEKLNFTMPDKWTWATKYIQEQIDLVKILEDKGYTYKTSDGIYFDTSKFKDYSKLARLNVKGLEAGKRVSMKEKKNSTDFALWKFSSSNKKREQEWDSPWGVGFPGWHIECSAMSLKEIGKQLDIHTGGIDHLPIHHTNEVAQSECALGVHPWVKFWMHCNFLSLKEGKMSKSSGNIVRLEDLEKKGYSAMDFRYLCLSTHYRKKIEFDFEMLDSAKNSLERLRNIISDFEDDGKINESYLEEFRDAVNDDLNIPEALQVLWKLVRDKDAVGKIKTIEKMDEVLGLDLLESEESLEEKIRSLTKDKIDLLFYNCGWKDEERGKNKSLPDLRIEEIKKGKGNKLIESFILETGINKVKEELERLNIPKNVLDLIKEREKVREKKDWKKADELRDKINELGYSIDDKEDGVKVRRL